MSGIEAQLQRRHVLRVLEIDHEETAARGPLQVPGPQCSNRRTWRGSTGVTMPVRSVKFGILNADRMDLDAPLGERDRTCYEAPSRSARSRWNASSATLAFRIVSNRFSVACSACPGAAKYSSLSPNSV